MKVLLVTSGLIPYPGLQGSTFVTWSIATGLQSLGHDVSVCIYPGDERYTRTEQLQPLNDKGIETYLLPSVGSEQFKLSKSYNTPTAKNLFPYYPQIRFTSHLESVVEQVNPDIMFLYTASAVAGTVIGKDWPIRVASTVDLDHVARMERFWFELRYEGKLSRQYLLRKWKQWLLYKNLGVKHIYVLSQCNIVINHALHHTQWLRRNGVQQVNYLPLPVYDSGKEVSEKRANATNRVSGPVRIIMVGSPRGIATLSGYPVLVDKVLPSLEKLFGVEGFEIHIIGVFEGLPASLEKKIRKWPQVIIRGYVEDISSEFENADIVLVTTPINLGFRTRIAEAFSYGSCVVAHSANGLGMPELQHNENILLADDGYGIAQACLELARNSSLRKRLSKSARETFEKYYVASKVCDQIAELVSSSMAQ